MATYGAGNKPSINDAITSMRSRLGGPRAVRRVKPRGVGTSPPVPMGDPPWLGGGGPIGVSWGAGGPGGPGIRGTAVRPPELGGGPQGISEMPPAVLNKPFAGGGQVGGAAMPAMPSAKPPGPGGLGGGPFQPAINPLAVDDKAGKGDVVDKLRRRPTGGGNLTADTPMTGVFRDAMTLPDGRTVGRDANNQFLGSTSTADLGRFVPPDAARTSISGTPSAVGSMDVGPGSMIPSGTTASMMPLQPEGGMGATIGPDGQPTIGAGLGGPPSGGIMGEIGGGEMMPPQPATPQPFTGRGGNVQTMGQGRFGGAPPQDVIARRQALQQRQRALMGKG